MEKLISLPLFCVLLLAFASCGKTEEELEPPTTQTKPLEIPVQPMISEVSGIADSKANPGHLWAQEDSGNPAQLYLLHHNGTVTKQVMIKGVKNRDWEDIALWDGEIYLADTGDNNENATSYTIYHFPEPSLGVDTIKTVSAIPFRYANGSHDAEAFLVDPTTKDILLITKRETPSKIYKIAYPYSSTSLNVAEPVGSLPYTNVVSAALSPNGQEAIIKTYTTLYHYRQEASEPLTEWLQRKPEILPYKLEPQGEAVTFAIADSGYFTLSEQGLFSAVNLYFYKNESRF